MCDISVTHNDINCITGFVKIGQLFLNLKLKNHHAQRKTLATHAYIRLRVSYITVYIQYASCMFRHTTYTI
jgi:hypothetical protein